MKVTAAVYAFVAAFVALLALSAPAYAATPPYVITTPSGGDCSLIGTWNTGTKTCTLNQNVTVSGAGGIVIGSDNITLDGGHAVHGDGVSLASGVEVDGHTGVTIKNLVVQGFEDGIYFGGMTNSTISGCNSSSNFRNGISVNSSGSITVAGNYTDSNSSIGIYDYNSTSDRIEGNSAVLNAADGIVPQNDTSPQITSNGVSDSPYGIFLSVTTGSSVRGNRVSNNSVYGIELNGSSNNSVSNNSFISNNIHAYVAGGSGNIFYGGLSPGNYWDNYNSPAQGCHDANADGICDSAYNFSGGSDPAPVTLPFELSSYFWSWYDDNNAYNWVLLGNRSTSAEDAWFDLSIAGSSKSLPSIAGFQPGEVPPGRSLTPMFGGTTGGPVVADSRAAGGTVASQRVLWPQGGSSLEEVPGTPGGALSNIFYWPWYDQSTPGMSDWVLVANPNSYQIYYEISIKGLPAASGAIAAGGKATPTFPGTIGGPVKVQAWADSLHSEPARVMASQRVLSGGGGAFNEMPGIPVNSLSSDYMWSWYDMSSAGAADWVLVANPGTQPIYYTITIGGSPVATGGPIAAGASAAPTFPGHIGGPVEVTTYTDPAHPGTSAAGSIVTQRSLWGPSFEEVPGRATDYLPSADEWTWYDQSTPGMTDWVLIANPDTTNSIYYEVRIGGSLVDSGQIGNGSMIEHTYPGRIGGPVDVETWTNSSRTNSARSLSSQRVLYNGYFNEVWGQ